jgi:hypothetical protein
LGFGGTLFALGVVFFILRTTELLESSHREREAVRMWLRENLDSGKWEEVKWYKPIHYGDSDRIASTFGLRPGEIEIKLKYRELTRDGGTLRSTVFTIAPTGKAFYDNAATNGRFFDERWVGREEN